MCSDATIRPCDALRRFLLRHVPVVRPVRHVLAMDVHGLPCPELHTLEDEEGREEAGPVHSPV